MFQNRDVPYHIWGAALRATTFFHKSLHGKLKTPARLNGSPPRRSETLPRRVNGKRNRTRSAAAFLHPNASVIKRVDGAVWNPVAAVCGQEDRGR
jgi:hypothetical protein